MRKRLAAALGAIVAGVLLMPTAASAAPTTQVIQGDVLRLVSVADWAAAASLLPGAPVRWDIEVSADAPDPGIVRIGVSATGSATLLLDVSLCADAWDAGGCPGGATMLRTDWPIPRDGAEIGLAEISDSEIAHLRLAITLDPADAEGSTDIRVHAHGAGESAAVGPGGGLATTGPSASLPWVLGAGAALVMSGGIIVAARHRDARHDAGGEAG